MTNNDNNQEHNEAQQAEQKILDAIRTGEVKSRPRWHFVLETALMVTGGIILAVLILYLASFIIFALQQSGVWFAPAFGAAGWYSLFRSLPWLLILLLIVFMLILAVLVQKYSVIYERPTLYLFVGLVVVVVGGGVLIAATPFHRDLMEDSRGGGLPVISAFYHGYGMQDAEDRDIHRGMIVGTTTTGFIIEDDNGQTSTIVLTGPMPSQPNGPGPGSEVVILGPRTPSGTINSQGVQSVGQ